MKIVFRNFLGLPPRGRMAEALPRAKVEKGDMKKPPERPDRLGWSRLRVVSRCWINRDRTVGGAVNGARGLNVPMFVDHRNSFLPIIASGLAPAHMKPNRSSR